MRVTPGLMWQRCGQVIPITLHIAAPPTLHIGGRKINSDRVKAVWWQAAPQPAIGVASLS
ncbi:hypothetical protein E2C01_083293 [Portunus trituberculatus]|uniref:Uncharacterized protein n=1 Tax=Portunus trituberculatus TaxID=210409 RepID=A0A5B7IWU3_PORTR|nr:hypothetical protein [Portunus trituberculatus]